MTQSSLAAGRTQLGHEDRSAPLVSAGRRIGGALPVVFAWSVLLAMAICALFGSALMPYSATAIDLQNSLAPPLWSGGDFGHPFGTDQLGRDVLSRLIGGARPTFIILLTGTLTGGGLGGILGCIAGYVGGKVDAVIMRLADAALALPSLLLALVLAITLGAGVGTVTIAVALTIWSRFARVIRAEVQSVREREWVSQATVDGCPTWRILLRHIMPHITSTWLVLGTVQLTTIILFEAGLSFLGAGVPPPNPTWGGMASDGRELLLVEPSLALVPSFTIFAVVLAMSFLGDMLRDKLDVHIR
jgi:peptide/nickel transport system permease protein